MDLNTSLMIFIIHFVIITTGFHKRIASPAKIRAHPKSAMAVAKGICPIRNVKQAKNDATAVIANASSTAYMDTTIAHMAI